MGSKGSTKDGFVSFVLRSVLELEEVHVVHLMVRSLQDSLVVQLLFGHEPVNVFVDEFLDFGLVHLDVDQVELGLGFGFGEAVVLDDSLDEFVHEFSHSTCFFLCFRSQK